MIHIQLSGLVKEDQKETHLIFMRKMLLMLLVSSLRVKIKIFIVYMKLG